MCGIAGIFAYRPDAVPLDRDELIRMREWMASRGPDGEGLWISQDRRIGLAHRRLAIIDVSEAGAQPMVDPDTCNQIVFNGEIYNYQAIRKELVHAGFQFRSRSDTEVLLKLYAACGPEMLRRLRGMYALAIWDQKRQGVFLARDPFGIKPLYLADDGKVLRFASQVKALLAGGKVDTSTEPAGHVGFFLWGHVPEPFTLYRGIRALPAGQWLWVDRFGHKDQKRFFDLTEELVQPQMRGVARPAAEAREILRNALLDSVRHHLVADVPVGVFLSAGKDSTTVAALAHEAGVKELRTATLGFEEFMGTETDEAPLAQAVASHLGAKHHTQWVRKGDFEGKLDQLLASMDQPSIDGVNTYFVSLAARAAGLKVALSGLGGDELFGGYSSFRDVPLIVRTVWAFAAVPALGRGFRYVTYPMLKRVASPKYAGLLEYGGDYGGAYLLRRGLYMPWELPQLLDGDLVREGWRTLQTLPALKQTVAGVDDPRLKVTALETAWYMRHQLLRDADWASMAHSLEVRVPLVDVELFRAVTQLVNDGFVPTKDEMVAISTRLLPDGVAKRRKTGFSVPTREWLIESGTVAGARDRGLRQWASFVYSSLRAPGTVRKAEARHCPVRARGGGAAAPFKARDNYARCLRVALLASEVCTYGGIQSFMLRVAEVIGRLVEDGRVATGYCISLNDQTEGLRFHAAMPPVLQVRGAGRSKVKFVKHTVLAMPQADVLLVGHLALGPLAYALKLSGRLRDYFLILYGVEAWRKASYLQWRALHGSRGIIAISRFTAEKCALYNQMDLTRFHIVPPPADERQITPTPGFKLNGEFKLLCVGRQDATERYKGFEQLFRVLASLRGGHGIHLNIVGQGDDQARVKRVARELGVEAQITFWGSLSDKDLAAAYDDCDVFVMPSKNEGFGIVFLEAMRRGKACIGGNHGGTPEVIEHGKSGFLVDYDDVQTLARYIRLLAEDPVLRRGLGQGGRRLVEEKFSQHGFRRAFERLILGTAE